MSTPHCFTWYVVRFTVPFSSIATIELLQNGSSAKSKLIIYTWLVGIYLLFILGILRGVRKFHRIVRFNADQHEGGEEANKNTIVDNIEIEDKLSKLKAEDKRCESFQTGL